MLRPAGDRRGAVGARVLGRSCERRDGGALWCEGVPLARIAEGAGTPAYVYSANALRERYRALDAALAGVPHRIHYSLKANSSHGLLQVLRAEGCAADVVSGGELMRAQCAGFAPSEIIFGGVGKSRGEIRAGLQAGVKLLNLESAAELAIVEEEARALGVRAGIALRVNPEVHVANAHEYIATGSRGHKFGIPWGDVPDIAARAIASKHVELLGLDMHVGSQLLSLDPYRDGVERLADLARTLQARGAPLRYLDAGGGLPARYDDEDAPDLELFASIIVPVATALGLELIVEPGRFVMAEAGRCSPACSTARRRAARTSSSATRGCRNCCVRRIMTHTTRSRRCCPEMARPPWMSWGRSARRATSLPATGGWTTFSRATCSRCTPRERTGTRWRSPTTAVRASRRCWWTGRAGR